jgi:hypothetical protein
MTTLAIALIIVCGVTLTLCFFIRRFRLYLLITSLFALMNSFIAAPLNWTSLVQGYGFWLSPISASSTPVSIHKLALPTDTPNVIIQKMGCFVCHKIPRYPVSRLSEAGPLLIPKTTALARINTPEYQERVKMGRASATTAREYIIESILDPDAFIVPGYEKSVNPEESTMYQHYDKRFTQGGLEKLADYLLTLDVMDAAQDGLIFAH